MAKRMLSALIACQFAKYCCPVVLADDPPPQGLLGKKTRCRAEGIDCQVVGHLLQRRVKWVLGAGEGPDLVDLAASFPLVIKGTGLFKHPDVLGLVMSA